MFVVNWTITQGLAKSIFVMVADQIVEMILAERNEAIQAFALDGSDPALDEAVEIG